jgi:hypothetical protein
MATWSNSDTEKCLKLSSKFSKLKKRGWAANEEKVTRGIPIDSPGLWCPELEHCGESEKPFDINFVFRLTLLEGRQDSSVLEKT